MSTDTLNLSGVRGLARPFWARGDIVIHGTFAAGPDQGDIFLVSQARTAFEDVLATLLDRPPPRGLVVNVQSAVRDVVDRGVWQVPATARDVFNYDIGLLMALELVVGADILPPAGVEMAILLDDNDKHPVMADGGLSPGLAKRLPDPGNAATDDLNDPDRTGLAHGKVRTGVMQ